MKHAVLWGVLLAGGLGLTNVHSGPTAIGIRYDRTLVHARDRGLLLAETVLRGDRERFVSYTTPGGSWRTQNDGTWTSGFVPGLFWYHYALGGGGDWKDRALHWSEGVRSRATATDNDTGFQIYSAYGLGLGFDPDGADYEAVLLEGAQTLVEERWNADIGCFRSWPGGEDDPTVLPFEVNIDQMMNLELILWAGLNGGPAAYVDHAVSHADKTWEHNVRPDGGTYHVVAYNLDGTVDYKRTHQGWREESTWSRGQAWAVYGYVMVYRYTGLQRMLERSRACYAYFVAETLKDAPDFIPYSDFDAPLDDDNPRDSSAAAIVACAALLLFEETGEAVYLEDAERILESLSSPRYLSRSSNYQSLLLKGSEKWGEPEVGAIFGDYFFLEALWLWSQVEQEPGVVTGSWLDHEVMDNRFADTGRWMGWVDAQAAPYIYNYLLEGWFFVPAGSASAAGGWIWSWRP